ADPAARRAGLLRPDDPAPDRPSVAVLALGLAPVPRGPARPARAPVRARGNAGRRRARARRPAAAEVAAPARRLQRCPADRLRGRADALVLRLPGLVLPVRRLRPPLAGGRARAGDG